MSIIDKPIVKTLMLKGEKGDPGDLDSTAIVDNLTTNRADKVLSARQGKVLKTLVDNNKISSDTSITYLNSALDLKANTADVSSTYATIESVNNNINSLDTKVNSLASGSPLVASSISDMTDTTRVYVNTTDGHWYYYNGSQWTNGGVYQATGIAEKSIEYDHLSDELDEILNLEKKTIEINSWEQGSINSSTGVLTTSTTRIRTNNTINNSAKSIYITIENGYKYRLFAYSDKTIISGKFVETVGNWLTESSKVILNPNYYYRIILAKIDDATITVDESSNIVVQEVQNSIKDINFDNLGDNLKNELTLEKEDVVNNSWEQGSIDSSTGVLTTSTTRIRTAKTSKFINKNISITLNNGYKASLFAYSDKNIINGKFIESIGWITDNQEIEINPDYYYRFVIAYNSDESITPDKADNLIIKEIVNKTNELANEVKKSLLRYRKHNHNAPQIVMHRGFTGLRSENTLPAYYMTSEFGIRYAKMDCQETLDNEFVMSHQEKMESPFVTPADNTKISDLTLAQIKSNYYISGPMYTDLYYNKLKMPTIDEALECCRETGLIPMLDMKTGTSYEKLYNKLCDYGLEHTACILTSRKEVLTAFRELDPYITLILWDDVSDENFNYLIDLGGNVGFFTNSTEITKEVVTKYHNAGIIFGTYPINDYTEIERVVDCGVDYIQTDQCSRDLKLNWQVKNLAWVQSGNTNYLLQLQDNECQLFNDVIELEVEVYYSSSNNPVTITIDGKTLVDSSKPGEWHKLKMQRVKRNSGVMTISVTSSDSEFMYNDLIIKRYIRGKIV